MHLPEVSDLCRTSRCPHLVLNHGAMGQILCSLGLTKFHHLPTTTTTITSRHIMSHIVEGSHRFSPRIYRHGSWIGFVCLPLLLLCLIRVGTNLLMLVTCTKLCITHAHHQLFDLTSYPPYLPTYLPTYLPLLL